MRNCDEDTKKGRSCRPEGEPPQGDAEENAVPPQALDLESRVAELESALAASAGELLRMTAERDTWQSKAATIHDQYVRAKSDFDGFRRRTERDFDDRLTRARADYLRSVLDVLDNFERFLAVATEGFQDGERDFDAFIKGVAMVYRQLLDTLAKEGVEPIESPVGTVMDPAFHEAVAAEEGGEHGTVLEEIQKGYVFKGLVLRPTKVKVAR